MSRILVAILGVLSAIALVFVQFLPWGGVSQSLFGASFDVDAYTWRMQASGEGFGGDFEDSENWYTGDFDEDDEEDGSSADDADLMKIRIAIPLLSAGLLLAAVAAILGFMARGPGALLLLIGGIVVAVGTALFALAVDSIFESDHDWGASFYLAIAASAMALIGGIVGLVGGGRGATN